MDIITEFLYSKTDSYFWSLTVFILFVLVFVKKGVKPIVAALDAREAKIKTELEESEAAYTRAKELQQQLDTELKGAEAKISEMMAEARRDAEALKQAELEKASSEIEANKQRALRDISQARTQALSDLRDQLAEISLTVASKVIEKELDEAGHRELVLSAVDAASKSEAVG